MVADRIKLLYFSDPQFGLNHLFGGSGFTVADRHVDFVARLHADLPNLPAPHGVHPNLASGGAMSAASEAR